MLLNSAEIDKFIASTYPNVTKTVLDREHIGAHCPICKRDVALKISHITSSNYASRYGKQFAVIAVPFTVSLQCPICNGLAIWVLYRIQTLKDIDVAPEDLLQVKSNFQQINIYRLAAIPPEGQYEIPDLPKEPASLGTAYSEAIRCLDNNCPIAAAAMFRRALQIITREILGAKPGKLADELASLVGIKNRLGVVLTTSFDTYGYIIREVGNQAAHPDRDPDLLSFTNQDAQDLYEIFLKIVAELFVAPTAAKKAAEGIMERRKLQDKSAMVQPKIASPKS
jgi:hypothetical protein